MGQPANNVVQTLHQFNYCRNPYKPDVAEDVAAKQARLAAPAGELAIEPWIGPEAWHPLPVLAEGLAESFFESSFLPSRDP